MFVCKGKQEYCLFLAVTDQNQIRDPRNKAGLHFQCCQELGPPATSQVRWKLEIPGICCKSCTFSKSICYGKAIFCPCHCLAAGGNGTS